MQGPPDPDPFAPPATNEAASDIVVRRTVRRVVLIHFLLLPFALVGGYLMLRVMPKSDAEVLSYVAIVLGLVAVGLDRTMRAPARLASSSSGPLPALPDAKIVQLFGVVPDTARGRALVALAIRFQAASIQISSVAASALLVCDYAIRLETREAPVGATLFALGVYLVVTPYGRQLRRAVTALDASAATE